MILNVVNNYDTKKKIINNKFCIIVNNYDTKKKK